MQNLYDSNIQINGDENEEEESDTNNNLNTSQSEITITILSNDSNLKQQIETHNTNSKNNYIHKTSIKNCILN